VALKRFLTNEWDRVRAQKRGGDKIHLSLDTSTGESRYQIEPAAEPDKTYERRWALTLLEQTMSRLREEYLAAGKRREFQVLKDLLTAERGEIPYVELAAKLGMNEGAVRVAVHRLRKRFRQLFRDEIAHTVSSPDEIDDEMRYLASIL
jgi:RNA polymerase sigma-70 factor (ECF subfamily)